MSDLLLRILVGTANAIDGFLSYIVVGGNLTDTEGNQVVDSMASIIDSLSSFLAQFASILMHSNVG